MRGCYGRLPQAKGDELATWGRSSAQRQSDFRCERPSVVAPHPRPLSRKGRGEFWSLALPFARFTPAQSGMTLDPANGLVNVKFASA